MRRVQIFVLLGVVFAADVYSETVDRVVLGLEPTVVFGISDSTTAVSVGGTLSGSILVYEMMGIYGSTSASFTQQAGNETITRSTALSVDVGAFVVPLSVADWFSVRGALLNELLVREGTWNYRPGAAIDLVVSPTLTDRLRFIVRGGMGYRFTGESGLTPRFGAGLGLAF